MDKQDQEENTKNYAALLLTWKDFQGMIYSRNVHKPSALLLARANHRSCTDTYDRCFPCLRWLNCTQAYWLVSLAYKVSKRSYEVQRLQSSEWKMFPGFSHIPWYPGRSRKRNEERGTRDEERAGGTGNGERGTGNGERGTRNGERGTGNGESVKRGISKPDG